MTLTALRTLSWTLVAGTVSCALLLSTVRIDPRDAREPPRRLAAADAAPPPRTAPPAPPRRARALGFFVVPAALRDR